MSHTQCYLYHRSAEFWDYIVTRRRGPPNNDMSKSSLSSVVSNLVRVSEPNTITDEDLDRHVAELILKEAKQKAERYLKEGVRAYLPSGYVLTIHQFTNSN